MSEYVARAYYNGTIVYSYSAMSLNEAYRIKLRIEEQGCDERCKIFSYPSLEEVDIDKEFQPFTRFEIMELE